DAYPRDRRRTRAPAPLGRRPRRRDRAHPRRVGRLRRIPDPPVRGRLARPPSRLSRPRRVRARGARARRPPRLALLVTVLRLLGVSHHSAPIELRVRVAFDLLRSAEVARDVAEPGG